jgi:cytochrome P450
MLIKASTIVSLVVGGVTLVVYLVVSRVAAWLRLRHVPGPFRAGWSKFWLVRRQAAGKLVIDLENACKEYGILLPQLCIDLTCALTALTGPLVRIGPNWVVTNDPAEIRRIWSVHSGYYRSPWYHGLRFDPAKDSIITATNNREHDHLRAQLLPGYSGKGIDNQEQLVDEQIAKYVDLIRRKYLSTREELRPLDMSRSMQYLTQDIISAIEFGKPFGYLDADEDIYGVIEIFEALLGSVMIAALFPILLPVVKSRLVKPFLPKPTDKNGVGRLLGVIKDNVDLRYGQDKLRNNDVLQSFIDSGLGREDVESEALIHMVGGTDTSALALRNIIFFVASNAVAYRKLQAEIDSAAKTLSSGEAVVSDQQAKALPYLQAVIKEGLRMWPPVMGLMARMSDQDDVICGLNVPSKTHVAWAGWALMKGKGVFGHDAHVFEPERWLNAEPAQLKAMLSVQGLTFASGSRWECLGKRLAYLELGKAVFEVSRTSHAPTSVLAN